MLLIIIGSLGYFTAFCVFCYIMLASVRSVLLACCLLLFLEFLDFELFGESTCVREEVFTCEYLLVRIGDLIFRDGRLDICG